MMGRYIWAAAVVLSFFQTGTSAARDAASVTPSTRYSAFVLAGRYTTEYFDRSLFPIGANYEHNFVVGGGWRGEGVRWENGISTGWEAGAGMRFGENINFEGWTGPYIKYDGLVIAETFRMSPSLTFGLSAVSGTMGTEQERAQRSGGSPTILFYLSPEIAFSAADNLDLEIFGRMHHRSGVWGTIGGGSANAVTIGTRIGF